MTVTVAPVPVHVTVPGAHDPDVAATATVASVPVHVCGDPAALNSPEVPVTVIVASVPVHVCGDPAALNSPEVPVTVIVASVPVQVCAAGPGPENSSSSIGGSCRQVRRIADARASAPRR